MYTAQLWDSCWLSSWLSDADSLSAADARDNNNFTKRLCQRSKRTVGCRCGRSVSEWFTGQLWWLTSCWCVCVLLHWVSGHISIRSSKCLGDSTNTAISVWSVREKVIQLWASQLPVFAQPPGLEPDLSVCVSCEAGKRTYNQFKVRQMK